MSDKAGMFILGYIYLLAITTTMLCCGIYC